ncbi:U32 family peptidase [Clostridium butyricum]|uniref:U32 family peptidase n=1 Tax=Clostridium butyricum TaxID=1492 RepID=UPI003D3275A1
MKIVAGLGCIDDYIRLVQAGADEVFCGYVPYEWNKKYGNLFPLNRREVLYYNVQISSLEDMKILKKMVDAYKVPVTITFNYLYYIDEQFELIEKIMKDLINIGFNEFIVADPALILYLEKKHIKCNVHLSGECAEINRSSIEFFNRFRNISRYIFHRKNTIKDMESCINENKDMIKEYEAFILNERCHYTGAFCSSLHCDEMAHLCKIQYHMAKIDKESSNFEEVDKKFEIYYDDSHGDLNFLNDENNINNGNDFNDEVVWNNSNNINRVNINIEEDSANEDTYKLGASGCGICSLYRLKKAGVTHLKVVGRGNYIDYMERDVKNLKKAIDMLEHMEDETDYEKNIKDNLFKGRCSKECYY